MANGAKEYQIKIGQKLDRFAIDGRIVVDLDTSKTGLAINKSFYGADSYEFSELPSARLVAPLQLGYLKLGGSLHSVYNWELNNYFDRREGKILYVYSPLERRLRMIKDNYKASPMFEVNMLGWQPDYNQNKELELLNTADSKHAAKAVTYINGKFKLGLKNILMGNEPFNSMSIHGRPIPSADEYIEKYIKYVMAIRKAQEKLSGNSNDINIWGPEIATGWIGWQTAHPKRLYCRRCFLREA